MSILMYHTCFQMQQGYDIARTGDWRTSLLEQRELVLFLCSYLHSMAGLHPSAQSLVTALDYPEGACPAC
uniref:Uncharacterized protein n=1 Tax=Arundo donax TaxID=35708 RepID=A0A0A9BLY2_ARUDO